METDVRCGRCSERFPAHVVDQFGGMCPACVAGFAEVPEEGTLQPGTPFGRYEILEVIGRGGMGVVYRARQTGLDRVVALKVLSDRLAADPEFVRRFTQEAKTLASLGHANIVAVHDYGVEEGTPFLVMEHVEGVSLRQLLSERRLPPEEALGIVPQLCDALEYAHSLGVVHRDIKPENILVDTRGRVRIADFGLAVMLGIEAPRFTRTDAVMGTPHYMAPEQVESPKTVDHRADLYSMGVVFYEMLTGELPIGAFSMPSQKARVHRRLDEIVLRALAKEPDRRYQHASELKKDLAAAPRELRPGTVVRGFEYRSKATLFGWPLVHVCFGVDAKGRAVPAKGIVAVGGSLAVGLVAVGGIALGGIALGGLSVGLLALGGGAIGLLLAFGGGALGGVAVGGGAAGVVALGGGAYGCYAMGGEARGRHVISWVRSDPEAVEFFSRWRLFMPDPFGQALDQRGLTRYADGMKHYTNGEWTKAVDLLSEVPAGHPNYVQAMQALGHIHDGPLKKSDEALRWFHRAYAADPSSAHTFGDLAAAMAKVGRKIERIEPGNDPHGEGMKAYLAGDYERAFSLLSRVPCGAAPYATAMRFIGYNVLVREWRRPAEEGIPYLDRAFAAAPGDPKVLEDIVRAYQKAGRKALPNGAPLVLPERESDPAADVADVPSQDLRAGNDPDKRYFLIAPREIKAPVPLVLVVPSGDGSEKFHPFVKRIWKEGLAGRPVMAQLVAKEWDPPHFDRLVWPTAPDRVTGMRFSTEGFAEAVIEDVKRRLKVEPSRIYVLAWSSGGPAGYAIATSEKRLVHGAFIAMSLFEPQRLDLGKAKEAAFYLHHSKDDKITPFRLAELAAEKLGEAGAKVRLSTYEGGHGWHGKVYTDLWAGFDWLEKNASR
jgi:predicted esterase/predicted Ser/Thr protein kinase